MILPRTKTKIVCTIGPASHAPVVMRRMIEAGMTVARLNFSHGDFETHRRVIEDLRAAAVAVGRRIAILADLPGPKMRIGTVDPEPVTLAAGAPLTLTTRQVVGDATRIAVSFARLPQAVRPGSTLFLRDGEIELEVTRVAGDDVHCTVRVGGELRSRAGLNLPGIDLGIGAFTDHDRACLAFALEHDVDAVSQSFVERAADVAAVREAAAALGRRPWIIAKIERAGALAHIEEILAAADGIMIARGDLGVELPIEEIALVQKRVVRLANRHARPVITATQMLESMAVNRRPTRAEATDVANAVLDGTDAVMLSGESALGRHPVEAVAMLARIAEAAERERPRTTVRALFEGTGRTGTLAPVHLVTLAVEASLEHASPAAVFVPTRSGATARRIAGLHVVPWVVAVSADEATCQQLHFSAGVIPQHEPKFPASWRAYVRRWVGEHGLAGDVALLTEGPSARHPDADHRMTIIDLATEPAPEAGRR